MVGVSGTLVLIARFFAQAWQFRDDDWVPIGGSALLGLLAAFNTWQVLAGRRRSMSVSHMQLNFSAAPLRWLEYGPWTGFSWTVVALATTGGGLWLARSIPHYWRRKNKAAVIVVTAASIGCCAITWMIVS